MSETWSELTADEVLEEFTPQESSTLKLIQGSNDRLPGIVTRVIAEVRDAFENAGRSLGDAGTIPDGLKARAIAVARWRLLISNPQLQKLQTKERQTASEQAMDYFERIAAREIKGPGSAEMVSSITRVATRAKLNGL